VAGTLARLGVGEAALRHGLEHVRPRATPPGDRPRWPGWALEKLRSDMHAARDDHASVPDVTPPPDSHTRTPSEARGVPSGRQSSKRNPSRARRRYAMLSGAVFVYAGPPPRAQRARERRLEPFDTRGPSGFATFTRLSSGWVRRGSLRACTGRDSSLRAAGQAPRFGRVPRLRRV
jgi:hypothetical protein